ncbi:23S rRNA (guanosine(2251)-2'-O)-methyltransferase RlmB [Sneathiella aquimaris]|uniref:23S rRNA (guanosine(2251)-2'-O)-methyltransferase RlmB n=1 Tax=Sneathiella aquimaris TaxID=2599305 RepID=UPI001469A8AC|nr:23S rRNA (guanosine(2251)-2'-O)-methyltransferase RlmB [Sneathiella aquimaris]
MTTRKPPKGQKSNFFEKGGKPGFSKGKKERTGPQNSQKDAWLYGDHAVLAALSNPDRKIRRLLLTKSKLDKLELDMQERVQKIPTLELVSADDIRALLPDQAIHQGIALMASPLKELDIEDVVALVDNSPGNAVAILDQVTDPHNVGAILRSAAAFNIAAVILPDRHSPPVTGVLARSASGAVETVPMVRVGNLSRAMDRLAEMGFWRIGMDGTAAQTLEQAVKGTDRLAIVLGSEGKGLRRLTSEKCDLLGKLPMSDSIESLNVSNAAAIAFYEINRANQVD